MSTCRWLKIVRSLASYYPDPSLLGLRRMKDLPKRALGLPHDRDFAAITRLGLNEPCIVDVGANRGQSIESLQTLTDSPVIHAFEPNPRLAGSLQVRYPDVTVHPVALSDHEGSMRLFTPCYGHTSWDTRASSNPGVARAFLSSSNFAFFDSRRARLDEESVPVMTLDSVGLAPNLLKIDAEGMESAILRGAQRTLESKPVVLVECCDAKVMDLMLALGYRPYRARGGRLEEGQGESNTYFLADRHSVS